MDLPAQKALIIIAHGSRRAAANEEFFSLVAQIASSNTAYDVVAPALLEQAPPTLMQACTSLPEQIRQIDVYPLFFNQGKHVDKDIPAQIAEVMEHLPEVEVRLLDYFGSASGLAPLVLAHLVQQASEQQELPQ